MTQQPPPEGRPPGPPQPPYGGPQPAYGRPPGPPPYRPHPGQPPLRPDEENTWALAATFGGLLLGWLAPLLVYAILKDRSAFVREVSREALNMQLSFMIWMLISIPLMFVLVGFLTFFVTWAGLLALTIIGGVKASNREPYRYPLTIRFLS